MSQTRNDSPLRKARRGRQERRFEQKSSPAGWISLAVTVVGGLLLGAGIYSQWVADPALSYASWIVGAGALVAASTIVWGTFGAPAVRVGDAGIGLERPGQPLRRIAWSKVRSVSVDRSDLVVAGESDKLSIRLKDHASAAAWIVKEAAARVPKTVRVHDDQKALLPQTAEADGELLTVEKEQVTGAKCCASGKVITFEKDARLCPRCGEVYHVSSVPVRCLTCEADLTSLKA
jgi:hypothetical protein